MDHVDHVGHVDHVFSTGANDVMVVALADAAAPPVYVPFIASVVLRIDLPGQRLWVDWDAFEGVQVSDASPGS